jgi:hypothetical protein
MIKAMTIATTALLLAGCNQGPEAPEKTVQQLMAEDVQPTAEIYWDAVQYISDIERGEYEILPETDEDWQRTRDAATRIGELARLLQTPAYAAGRGEDWMQFAVALDDVSKMAEQAADERSTDKVFEVGGTVYSVCKACHDVYPSTAALEGEAVERPGDET